MEPLHTGFWSAYGCPQALALTAALVVAVLLFTGAILWAIVWVVARRRNEPRVARIGLAVIAPVLMVLLVLAGGLLLAGDPAFHRISVGAGALRYEGCRGTADVSLEVPLADIVGFAHRSRWAGGRSRRLADEIVVSAAGRPDLPAIPLTLDPAVTNHEALARLLPPPAVAAYRQSLARRNLTLPAAYADP